MDINSIDPWILPGAEVFTILGGAERTPLLLQAATRSLPSCAYRYTPNSRYVLLDEQPDVKKMCRHQRKKFL